MKADSGPTRARCPECRRVVACLRIRGRLHFTGHPATRHGDLLAGDACTGTGWLVEDEDRIRPPHTRPATRSEAA